MDTSRADAGRGLWLRGDGHGHLAPVRGQDCGVRVYGEQRGAALGDFDGDGRVDLVVTQNRAETKLFRNVGAKPGLRVRLDGPPGNPCGIGAVVAEGVYHQIKLGSPFAGRHTARRLIPVQDHGALPAVDDRIAVDADGAVRGVERQFTGFRRNPAGAGQADLGRVRLPGPALLGLEPSHKKVRQRVRSRVGVGPAQQLGGSESFFHFRRNRFLAQMFPRSDLGREAGEVRRRRRPLSAGGPENQQRLRRQERGDQNLAPLTDG